MELVMVLRYERSTMHRKLPRVPIPATPPILYIESYRDCTPNRFMAVAGRTHKTHVGNSRREMLNKPEPAIESRILLLESPNLGSTA